MFARKVLKSDAAQSFSGHAAYAAMNGAANAAPQVQTSCAMHSCFMKPSHFCSELPHLCSPLTPHCAKRTMTCTHLT